MINKLASNGSLYSLKNIKTCSVDNNIRQLISCVNSKAFNQLKFFREKSRNILRTETDIRIDSRSVNQEILLYSYITIDLIVAISLPLPTDKWCMT